MQRTTIMLASILLLAGSGLVSAKPTTDCADPQDESEIAEGVRLEFSEGRYFYLPSTDEAGEQVLDKAGFWEESNRRGGLQTDPCLKLGVRLFEPDTPLGMGIP